MTPEILFTRALLQVESASIRAWAQTDRNRPLWLEMASGHLEKYPHNPDPSLFAGLIVATAIGL